MTKVQEQELLKQMSDLQKQVSQLFKLLENNKLDKHAYSVSETAQILGKTPQAVYKMIEREELETVKLGHIKIQGTSLRKKLGVCEETVE